LPITARGAGTGLLGQSLSNGVLIDCTKHMNQIIESEDDYVVVDPGTVKDVLDRELRRRGKFLPPDPASSNHCTVGGMIANNSSDPQVKNNSCGYRLDAVLNDRGLCPHREIWLWDKAL
jgi:glycolate oxidase